MRNDEEPKPEINIMSSGVPSEKTLPENSNSKKADTIVRISSEAPTPKSVVIQEELKKP